MYLLRPRFTDSDCLELIGSKKREATTKKGSPRFRKKWFGYSIITMSSRYLTACLKVKRFTVIVISIGLKFLSHRKHLARLVLGFVAVTNSEQIGQRNLKYPSDTLDGNFKNSAINIDIGMPFRNCLNLSFEYFLDMNQSLSMANAVRPWLHSQFEHWPVLNFWMLHW